MAKAFRQELTCLTQEIERMAEWLAQNELISIARRGSQGTTDLSKPCSLLKAFIFILSEWGAVLDF